MLFGYFYVKKKGQRPFCKTFDIKIVNNFDEELHWVSVIKKEPLVYRLTVDGKTAKGLILVIKGKFSTENHFFSSCRFVYVCKMFFFKCKQLCL